MRPTWRRHPTYGHTLRLIEAVVEGAWCRETASPSCQAHWSEQMPSDGQCAVTTLVVEQALREDFGITCEILRAEVKDFGSHYWLRLPDGTEVDMTRDQFPDWMIVPPGETRTRESLLTGERALAAKTPERFEMLDSRASRIYAIYALDPIIKFGTAAIEDMRSMLDRETKNPAP